MKIMFQVLQKVEYPQIMPKQAYYQTLCGSDYNWIMHDLKTVKGYLNRLKKSVWCNKPFILMTINDSVSYVIANSRCMSYKDTPSYLAIVDANYNTAKNIETHYKIFD